MNLTVQDALTVVETSVENAACVLLTFIQTSVPPVVKAPLSPTLLQHLTQMEYKHQDQTLIQSQHQKRALKAAYTRAHLISSYKLRL